MRSVVSRQNDNTSKMMYYEGVMDIYDYTTSGGKNLIKEYIEKFRIH